MTLVEVVTVIVVVAILLVLVLGGLGKFRESA
jgi:type II secretory pathway pseudopilin PulG